MAKWQDRCAVPDSEDDTESSSYDSTLEREPTQDGDDRRFQEVEEHTEKEKTQNFAVVIPKPRKVAAEEKKLLKQAGSLGDAGTEVIDVTDYLFQHDDDDVDELQLNHMVKTQQPEIIDKLHDDNTRHKTTSRTHDLEGDDIMQSNTSSPLSSVHLSDEEIPELLVSTLSSGPDKRRASSTISHPIGSTHPPCTGISADKESNIEISNRVAPRTFRRRNPEQLYPYAIESERYKRTLKGRGLQPLRIEQRDTQEDDSEVSASDEQDSCASPVHKKRLLVRTSQDISSSPPPTPVQNLVFSGSSQVAAGNLEDEEFPDLSTMLRKPLSHEARKGFKKTKISHTYSKQDRHLPTISATHPLNSSSRQRKPPRQDQPLNNIFDIPPSPPTSGLRSSSLDAVQPPKNSFRMPLELPTPQLQTPVISSDHTNHGTVSVQRNDTIRMDSSDSEPVRHSDRRYRELVSNDDHILPEYHNPLEHESEESDSPNIAEEEERQLQKVQRRIRGVLPASWLRLDMKNGVGKAQRHVAPREAEPFISPDRGQSHRGVARPLSRPNGNHPTMKQPMPIVVSDDSTSEQKGSSKQLLRRESRKGNVSLGTTTLDWSDSDSMEDDRVDPMLQTETRHAAVKQKKRRVRQTALNYSGRNSRAENQIAANWNKTGSSREKLIKSAHRHVTKGTQSKAAKALKPRLGILDIYQTLVPCKQPTFINLALRSAWSRRDCGRQSPSKKAFRLTTREDTANVQTTLASWRSGSLDPRRQAALAPRKRVPFKQTSGNQRPPCFFQDKHDQPEIIQSPVDEPFSIAKSPANGQGSVDLAIQSILARQRSQGTKYLQATAGFPRPPLATLIRKPQQRHLSSNIRARGSARPALLETLAAGGSHAPVGPHSYKTPRPLITTTASFESNPILDRFLSEQTLNLPENSEKAVNGDDVPQVHHDVTKIPPAQHHRVPRARRKLSPKQLDVRNLRFHQAIEIEDEDLCNTRVVSADVYEPSNRTTLCGLGPYGTEYSLDFGIEPTTPGPHFWKSLSGESLNSTRALGPLKRRNLDQSVDCGKYTCFGKKREWGAWTESLHSELSAVSNEVARTLRSISGLVNAESRRCQCLEAMHALNSISRFIADSLHFLDPIDRASFTRHTLTLVSLLLEEVDEQVRTVSHDPVEPDEQIRRLLRNVAIQVLAILTQIRFISAHYLVPTEASKQVNATVEQAFRCSVRAILFPDLKETWLHIRRSEDVNTYQSDEYGQAACVIEILHIATDLHLENMFQEEYLKVLFGPRMTRSNDVRTLEGIWRDTFTLLPFFRYTLNSERVDAQRPEYEFQQWTVVKRLIEPVLEAYKIDSHGQAPTFNLYLRTLIGRCLKIAQQWHWQRPEGIIGTFFDFFASNNLGNLEHEYSYGPSTFLQQLKDSATLVFLPRDSSFQIYLKLLGVSLRLMRSYYPLKKIRDIAWRYMPNHGRNLPKDQSIRHQDLEALSNHHDLLCTLYWASPPEFRPRLTAIQDLVQIETSHREACHIHIRTWSNLVAYQLSTDETPDKLEAFAKWITNVLAEAQHLHSLARSEVESQVKAAEVSGLGAILPEHQEAMIVRNQRQIEAVLEDAVVSIKIAIGTARTSQAAFTLFPCSLSRVLEMFDPRRPRTNAIAVNALEAYSALTRKYLVEQGEKDSQEYGDWSAFEDENQRVSWTFLEEKLLRPVHQLLSNTLGIDNLLDDTIVSNVVDTWADVLLLAVSQGSLAWGDVLGPYGSYTWKSLRDTEQTRKYTPFAFASLIKKDKAIFKEHEGIIYRSWLASCLERDSMLKFQHLLTAAVLDYDNADPLFNNLQSTIRRQCNNCANSINEFRSHRSGLLSTVLATLRENLDYRAYHGLGDRAKPKQDFVDLVKDMMSTMKRNFQDLCTSTSHAGSYVEFVHTVIRLLQQYAADICPIDRFFTDSPEFPAPATDPAYVVDRILNYVRRPKDGISLKQMVSFIQNLIERAVIGNNVEELATQFESAMLWNGGSDRGVKDTLLHRMLDIIASVYVDVSFSTRCGWLLAQPVLIALRGTFTSLISWVQVGNRDNHDKMSSIVINYLELVVQNTGHWVDKHRDFYARAPLPSPAWTMTLQSVTAILPLLNYLYQNWPKSNLATNARNQFLRIKRIMRHYKCNCYNQQDDKFKSGPYARQGFSGPVYSSMAISMLKEVKATLDERWQVRDREKGAVYTKSSLRSEWIKVADGYDQDTDTFLDAYVEFNRVHAGLPALYEREDDEDEDFRRAKEPETVWDWRDEVPPF